jgi:hypothetical protein
VVYTKHCELCCLLKRGVMWGLLVHMQDLHEPSSDLESKAVIAPPRRRSRRRFKHAPRPHGRFVTKPVLVDIPDENPQVCLASHWELFVYV